MEYVTVENFDERFAESLRRLRANVDLEVTEGQKFDAEGQYKHVAMNMGFFRHWLGKKDFAICNTCGAMTSFDYVEPVKSQMLEHGECHHCNYWRQLALKTDPARLVIDGHIYGDGGNQPNAVRKDWLGFGGHVWKIERDGKVWETNNLWSGSTVPQRWIEHFPNNACFVKE